MMLRNPSGKKQGETIDGLMMWGGDSDDDTPPVPKFGGMIRIKNPKQGCDDEIFAWSGTDPDAPKVMMYSWSVKQGQGMDSTNFSVQEGRYQDSGPYA